MKVKPQVELEGPIYVMGVSGRLVPKYRIVDGNKIWDNLYNSLKKKYPNFKRNASGELVLWGCLSDIRRGFAPIYNDDIVNYFCGVEVYGETCFEPFDIYRIPKCTFVTCVLTNKEFKLEYTKAIKEVKKYITKNDYNLVGPVQEKYEGDYVKLYFPIEIIE